MNFDETHEKPPPKTYRIVGPEQGVFGIECLRCGMTSWNREDVKNKYCASCHAFHEGRRR